MHYMYYNNGILGWIMSILHMALPVLLIFLLFTPFHKRDSFHIKSGGGSSKTALDLLRGRYARGEMSREGFRQMKEDINTSL